MEPEVYLRHIENEETHWWFKSRRKIICSIIERNLLSGGKKLNILDYGACGGTNVEMLSYFGNVYVYEKDEKTSKFLIEKFKNNKNIKIVNQLDYKDFFDLIIAADVIEHIEDDAVILKYFSNLLNEFLFMIFNMEKYLLRIFNFPFGLSLILIARKIK